MTGTEDFSAMRLRSIQVWTIHRKTGNLNKGGHMIREQIGTIRCNNSKDAHRIAQYLYGKDIQLRKC